MATAAIQPLTACVRVWPGFHRDPDPYTFAATVRWIEADEVELLGCVADMTPETWKALCHAFAMQNVRVIRFTRKNGNRERVIRVDTASERRIRSNP